ncbi:hypothetical protein D3C72_1095710 [compost metagenome]
MPVRGKAQLAVDGEHGRIDLRVLRDGDRHLGMPFAHELQHDRLHALGQSLAAPGAGNPGETLEHAVGVQLVPAGVAHGGHLVVGIAQQHEKVLAAAPVDFGVPGVEAFQLEAQGRAFQRAGGRVFEQRGQRRHQRGQPIEGHAARVDLQAQPVRGREGVGAPACERRPVEAVEGHAVLDAAVLFGRTDGREERPAFRQVGLEGRSGGGASLHQRQKPVQQGAGHALALVRSQHAAPHVDERREGRIVGRAFAAHAHVEAADDAPLCVPREGAVHHMQRRVLAHVLLGVGVVGLRLARKVFVVALAPVGQGLCPLFSGRPLRIERRSRELPRIGGTGFKHGEP